MPELPTDGDAAPDFALPDDTGAVTRLADFAGQPLVLYFYPKDDTSGCTLEAQDFDAAAPAFRKVGCAIVGVSPDPEKSHRKFKQKYDLGLRLLSDESKATLEAYGVWQEKSMYGRKYMGVDRSTFLIDRTGRIVRAWRKVKVPGHAEEVLATAKTLAKA
jgi:peroxiredoxin Q/BCP